MPWLFLCFLETSDQHNLRKKIKFFRGFCNEFYENFKSSFSVSQNRNLKFLKKTFKNLESYSACLNLKNVLSRR